MRGGYADPSLIIAAELAFNRLAVEKGQWTALGRLVAKDAVLFQPAPVFAERWLKGRRDPPVPVRWQTQQVFMACDGGTAISTGLWSRSGGESERGWFANIWRRDKKGYRLVLHHDGPSATPQAAPGKDASGEDELEAMTARIATCPRRGRPGDGATAPRGGPSGAGPATAPLDPSQPLPTQRDDGAADGTLRWRWSVTPGGARTLEAWMATDGGEALILTDRAGQGGS